MCVYIYMWNFQNICVVHNLKQARQNINYKKNVGLKVQILKYLVLRKSGIRFFWVNKSKRQLQTKCDIIIQDKEDVIWNLNKLPPGHKTSLFWAKQEERLFKFHNQETPVEMLHGHISWSSIFLLQLTHYEKIVDRFLKPDL